MSIRSCSTCGGFDGKKNRCIFRGNSTMADMCCDDYRPLTCVSCAGLDENGCCAHGRIVSLRALACICPDYQPKDTRPKGTTVKDTNPKDAVGIKKWRQFCTVPKPTIWAIGVAMLEGARKYGRHNYRASSVRASVYLDAAKGHLDQFEEGENIDPDSGLHHLAKAAASVVVLLDGVLNDNWVDDRPMKCNLDKIRAELQEAVDTIFEKYPDPVKPYLEIDGGKSGGQKCDPSS